MTIPPQLWSFTEKHQRFFKFKECLAAGDQSPCGGQIVRAHIMSFGALFDPLSAPKRDPGKYLRSPWTVDEKCITGGVNVGSRWGSKFGAYSHKKRNPPGEALKVFFIPGKSAFCRRQKAPARPVAEG